MNSYLLFEIFFLTQWLNILISLVFVLVLYKHLRTHKNPRCNTRKTRKSSTWVNMLSLLNMQDASCVLHQSNASNRSMYTQHWASCQKSERPLCIRNSHQLVRKNYTEPLHSEITGTSCLTMSAHASVWL